ncbi:hypothetical protein EV424DRAFT_1343556 [Suillus variegatus]|nr:hypothetical protein EV424DRAFT_1343556 [Suillus variegatus]
MDCTGQSNDEFELTFTYPYVVVSRVLTDSTSYGIVVIHFGPTKLLKTGLEGRQGLVENDGTVAIRDPQPPEKSAYALQKKADYVWDGCGNNLQIRSRLMRDFCQAPTTYPVPPLPAAACYSAPITARAANHWPYSTLPLTVSVNLARLNTAIVAHEQLETKFSTLKDQTENEFQFLYNENKPKTRT